MADFNLAQKFVSLAEGGYTDNPLDNGNWTGGQKDLGDLIGTNHGISAPTLCQWYHRKATKSDMQNLPYSVALEIYKKNYWDALDLSDLHNQSLALLIYDGAVNQGVAKMTTFIKATLEEMDVHVAKNEDVRSLISKINSVPNDKFFEIFWNIRKSAYNSKSPFYKGWIKRLEKIKFFNF